jgi:L-alanine-DL-glutamate epimerase-like enolase superfamily enzyme
VSGPSHVDVPAGEGTAAAAAAGPAAASPAAVSGPAGDSAERIELASAFLCDVPVLRPRTDAVQAFVKQETIFVEVVTASGVRGLGYSYTIGTGGRAVLELLRTALLEQLIGRDVTRPEDVWTMLHRSTRALMVGPVTTLALAAIDTAIWDARAKRCGLSLSTLAGGAQRAVPVYDTEGGWLHLGLDELVSNATAALAEGRRGVKVKVGKPDASEDVARLSAVREAIGPSAVLMVDANQGFTRDEAQRRARLFEPFDLAWIEEPLPADDVAGHALLARATAIPLAVGETLYSLAQFREYLTAGAASVVQVDVARIGGITPWLKVAHLAEAFDLPVAPHFLMELHVSLAAAVPNGRWVEWIPQLDPLTSSRIRLERGGYALPPSQPGLGIEWEEPMLKRTRVA